MLIKLFKRAKAICLPLILLNNGVHLGELVVKGFNLIQQLIDILLLLPYLLSYGADLCINLLKYQVDLLQLAV